MYCWVVDSCTAGWVTHVLLGGWLMYCWVGDSSTAAEQVIRATWLGGGLMHYC